MTEQEQYTTMLIQQNQQLSSECTERMKIIALLSRQLASLEVENTLRIQRLQKAEVTLRSFQVPPEVVPDVPEPQARSSD
jgi:hypothetical protein